MKRLLKLTIASMMIIGATTFVSAQDIEYEEIRSGIKSYKNLSIIKENGRKSNMRSAIEKKIIRRGDSTRYKVLWDTDSPYMDTECSYVEGIGETTPEDLRKGEFEVVLKPDKTTTYKCVHKFRGVQGRSCEREYDFTVVVLEPEKYDSVMQLRSCMNSQQRGIQFRELKGEKVSLWEKAIINKLAKMNPKERREYEKKLERQYSRMRK